MPIRTWEFPGYRDSACHSVRSKARFPEDFWKEVLALWDTLQGSLLSSPTLFADMRPRMPQLMLSSVSVSVTLELSPCLSLSPLTLCPSILRFCVFLFISLFLYLSQNFSQFSQCLRKNYKLVIVYSIHSDCLRIITKTDKTTKVNFVFE